MKIQVHNGRVRLRSLIKPFAIGHALGWGVLMLPMLVIMIPIMILAPSEIEGANGALIQLLLMPIMMPVILVLQGIMIGCIAAFGLWVYRSRGQIEIEETND
jgi:hypothetical protein